MKRACAVVFFAAAVFALRANALAVTEYCPASVDVSPRAIDPASSPQVPPYKPADAYNVHFSAESPRRVTGNLEIHTDGGWYKVPFNDIALAEYNQKWRGPTAEFTREKSFSDYYFIRFPKPVKLLAAFVSDAESHGDAMLGWDAHGHVGCMSEPDVGQMPAPSSRFRPKADIVLLNPTPAPETIPANAVFLAPSPSDFSPGSTDCANPFAMASVSNAVSPTYPSMVRQMGPVFGISLIEVAVSETGALDEAWVYAPSGNELIDEAALKSARASTYVPARSFCQNIPGLYIFRAEFRP